MKATKKWISLLAMAMLLALGLTACSVQGGDATALSPEPAAASQDSSAADTTQTEDESQAPDSDTAKTGLGKVLVAYYSGTGNTARVAQDIADDTEGALFEITPADPYVGEDLNFNDPDSRISHEYADESLRDVPLTTTEVPDWSSYDTVFVGYPIWWGNPAWAIYHFVSDNDFTGKTVIPFCTSESSGIGSTGETLHEMANTGNWENGQRFDEDATAEEVERWVESL